MKFKSIQVAQHGGPDILQMIENELRPPAAGEARLRVLAVQVCRPDVSVRRGESLYAGTPLDQKLPFTPGYAAIGEIDALGADVAQAAVGERVGVLTVTGGYSEYLYWRADRLIPLPGGLDPAEAVTLILNYIVAHQTLHRAAKARPGEKALIIGASGGIGTALLQLGQLAGLEMYGVASQRKHAILEKYGASSIDYHTQDFVQVMHSAEPTGIDIVLDGGTMHAATIQRSLSLLRRDGRMVSFGEPANRRELLRILATLLRVNLLPNGKSLALYGTSSYFLFSQKPYLEDWAILFELLRQGKIKPVIAAKFPILEAAQANALLESGQVTGNVVLVTPELL